jgi:hypothetical protein
MKCRGAPRKGTSATLAVNAMQERASVVDDGRNLARADS